MKRIFEIIILLVFSSHFIACVETPVRPFEEEVLSLAPERPEEPQVLSAALLVQDQETPEGAPFSFSIQLDSPLDVDLRVAYRTQDITAVAGTHYQASEGSLTIPAGSTEALVEIQTTTVRQNLDTTFELEIINTVPELSSLAKATATIKFLPLWRSCWEILTNDPAAANGVHLVDPDGPGVGVAAFDVYCDMTTNGGGWTLVDNDASTNSTFTSRTIGANTDMGVTKGSYLPEYQWSVNPQMMVVASQFTGSVNWVSFAALNNAALEYPTETTETATQNNSWDIVERNNNTDRGVVSYIIDNGQRFGSVWIGDNGNPTAACAYQGMFTGLGQDVSAIGTTCSTWVR